MSPIHHWPPKDAGTHKVTILERAAHWAKKCVGVDGRAVMKCKGIANENPIEAEKVSRSRSLGDEI